MTREVLWENKSPLFHILIMSGRRRSNKTIELPPPPRLELEVGKATKTIRTSLEGLHSCLFCPLCNHVFTNPVTLPACAHSFCQSCIREYSCNNYNCPTCHLPITLRGSREGGFDKTNPQIETVVTSFRTICGALSAAPNQWWKQTQEPDEVVQDLEVVEGGTTETYTFDMPRDDDEEDDEVMEELPAEEEEVMDDFQIHGPKLTMDDDATELFPPVDCNSSFASRRSCSLPSQSPNCSMIPTMDSQPLVTTPAANHNHHENEKENIPRIQLPTPKINNDNNAGKKKVYETPIEERASTLLTIENNTHSNRKRKNSSQTTKIASNDNDDLTNKKSRASNDQQRSMSEENVDLDRSHNKTPEITKGNHFACSSTNEKHSSVKSRKKNTREASLPSRLENSTSCDNNKDSKTMTVNTTKKNSLASKKKKDNHILRIFCASKFSAKDTATLETLEKQNAIEIVSSLEEEDDDDDVIALCGNAEMETGDGWLVGLTYGYLWAMARGIPILHASYLSDGSYKKNKNKNKKKPEAKQRVIGIGSSVDWMGPQRAQEAMMQEKKLLLLQDYTIILVGKFDQLPQSRRGGTALDSQHTVYSKTRIHTLLRLCGATVFEEIPNGGISSSSTEKVAFLIRPNPRSVDWRLARKVVVDPFEYPIISANWLLDSLADYRCKDWNNYTQASRHVM